MKPKALAKLIKERPYLWAVKSKWDPVATLAKVGRKDMHEFIVFMNEVWPQILRGEATLWLHIVYGHEGAWGGFSRDAEQVVPFRPNPKIPNDWVKGFFFSLHQGGGDEAFFGALVDEIVYVYTHPSATRDDVLIVPKPWDRLNFRVMLLEHGDWISAQLQNVAVSK